MFYLSKIEHTLRLPPHLLRLPLNEAIKLELENVFLDKVIANLGLCISIYDIKEIEGGFVYPGEGASTHTVKFRLVVFRPFVGEIIAAKLKESDANVSLGFFEDIYVPSHLLPSPSRSEPDPYGSVNYPSIPIEQAEGSKPFAPMVINGSIDYDGLGPSLIEFIFDVWMGSRLQQFRSVYGAPLRRFYLDKLAEQWGSRIWT
ncbi:hypothetical protein CUMW_166830 [Citrus unshiu]|uniref:DNA-directed RNA polymerase subunit n=1 Tax=Citrus unshiu TaxID=55188 RepID=A0A2H5PTU3_CITUN|nr:hypothetical protein CUMW_166830 [Citrus unshiu]